MLTFDNDIKLKEELLVKLKHHQDLDTFIQGTWLTDEKVEGNGFKGCFYGCTMQTAKNPIRAFSDKYHIDLWYCYLTEKLFEGLPDGEYQKFPLESVRIIPVGCDLNVIRSAFERGKLLKMLDWVQDENVIEVIHQCANLFLVPFHQIDKDAAWSARSAARSARSAAASAARSAAWSAAESARLGAESAAASAAWSAAASAARSAAWSAAESAAESARSAAESAWSAAWSTRSAAESAAWSAAWSTHYIWMRDFLFECVKTNDITPIK